jgi:hypothetical protein
MLQQLGLIPAVYSCCFDVKIPRKAFGVQIGSPQIRDHIICAFQSLDVCNVSPSSVLCGVPEPSTSSGYPRTGRARNCTSRVSRCGAGDHSRSRTINKGHPGRILFRCDDRAASHRVVSYVKEEASILYSVVSKASQALIAPNHGLRRRGGQRAYAINEGEAMSMVRAYALPLLLFGVSLFLLRRRKSPASAV